jgi:hypothetical protein
MLLNTKSINGAFIYWRNEIYDQDLYSLDDYLYLSLIVAAIVPFSSLNTRRGVGD